MANNFVQPGNVMDYQNSSTADIESGDVVEFESSIGIALVDIPMGESGSVQVTGVFRLPKSTAALEQGKLVFWKESQIVAATSEGAVPAGTVFFPADASTPEVEVKIG